MKRVFAACSRIPRERVVFERLAEGILRLLERGKEVALVGLVEPAHGQDVPAPRGFHRQPGAVEGGETREPGALHPLFVAAHQREPPERLLHPGGPPCALRPVQIPHARLGLGQLAPGGVQERGVAGPGLVALEVELGQQLALGDGPGRVAARLVGRPPLPQQRLGLHEGPFAGERGERGCRLQCGERRAFSGADPGVEREGVPGVQHRRGGVAGLRVGAHEELFVGGGVEGVKVAGQRVLAQFDGRRVLAGAREQVRLRQLQAVHREPHPRFAGQRDGLVPPADGARGSTPLVLELRQVQQHRHRPPGEIGIQVEAQALLQLAGARRLALHGQIRARAPHVDRPVQVAGVQLLGGVQLGLDLLARRLQLHPQLRAGDARFGGQVRAARGDGALGHRQECGKPRRAVLLALGKGEPRGESFVHTPVALQHIRRLAQPCGGLLLHAGRRGEVHGGREHHARVHPAHLRALHRVERVHPGQQPFGGGERILEVAVPHHEHGRGLQRDQCASSGGRTFQPCLVQRRLGHHEPPLPQA
jgi:hypothetical protein